MSFVLTFADNAKDSIYKPKSVAQENSTVNKKQLPVENLDIMESVPSTDKKQQNSDDNVLPDENDAYYSGNAISPGLFREPDMKPNFPLDEQNVKSDVSKKEIIVETIKEDNSTESEINISEQETSIVEGRHGAKPSLTGVLTGMSLS